MKQIETANAEAVRRILAGDPVLVDVIPAGEAIPALNTGRKILHAGPPIGWDRMCGPMRGAVTGIAVFEGWARDLDDAERKAADGAFEFQPEPPLRRRRPDDRHDHASSQLLMVVENRAFGNRAYCAINEGLGKVMRFGGNDAEVLDRLALAARRASGRALGARPARNGRHPAEAAGRARPDDGRRDAPAQRRLLVAAAAPARTGAGPHVATDTTELARCLDLHRRATTSSSSTSRWRWARR